jgi:hypothetical protein
MEKFLMAKVLQVSLYWEQRHFSQSFYATSARHLGHYKLSTCLPKGIEIVPPWSTSVTFCQNSTKFSPELWHFSPQVQKRYDYVTKRTRKSIKKSVFVFKPGIKSLSTCLPVGIEIVPPFSTTVQPSASPQAINVFVLAD